VTTITIWSISNRCKIVAGLCRWKGSTTMNKLLVLTALGLFLGVHFAVALLMV
jgi:hypothetical protein